MNKLYMWKYKSSLCGIIIAVSLLSSFQMYAQSIEADSSTQTSEKNVFIGLSFDYLKLHHFITTDNQKLEAALNINLVDKVHLIASYGLSTVIRESDYQNADYLVEGNYYRLGADYSLDVNPANKFMLGLRYAGSTYDETINYQNENPLFPDQSNTIKRTGQQANWFELVLTSEKRLNRIFQLDVHQILAVGMKIRIKTALDYPDQDFAPTKYVTGYGMTNTKVNPEFNLYLKLRIKAFSL